MFNIYIHTQHIIDCSETGYLGGARRTPTSDNTVDNLVSGTQHGISVYIYNTYTNTEH